MTGSVADQQEEGIYPSPGAVVLLTRSLAILVGYSFIHLSVDLLVGRRLARKWKLLQTDRVSVSEKVCSTLNALYTAYIGYKTLLSRVYDGPGGALATYTADMDYFFPNYLAYSLYDIGTMLFQPEMHFTMFIHHGMGAYGAFGMMFFRRMSIFPSYFMITEITAVVQNWLWVEETFGASSKYKRQGDGHEALLRDEGPATKTSPQAPSASGGEKGSSPSPKSPPTLRVVQLHGLRAVAFLLLRSWCAPFSVVHASLREGGFFHMLSKVSRLPGWGPLVGWSGLLCVVMFSVLNILWTVATFKTFFRRYKWWASSSLGKKQQ
ncbi:hypothetical protein DFJ73DRAFT_821707 [Zopfochytrium polystomum]|nr:hypothetical protein DFJ73DRAFT_821707 [Zopfochytrium polystomum]